MFLNIWKRWALLETSVFMQPLSQQTFHAPQGRRRVRLSCNFGFRDKCSLPFSGGAELLPAIKALKSNSSFPRESNLLPPIIKAPPVAVVLLAQPSNGTASHQLLTDCNIPLPLLHQYSYGCICAMNWSRK